MSTHLESSDPSEKDPLSPSTQEALRMHQLLKTNDPEALQLADEIYRRLAGVTEEAGQNQ